MAGTQSAWGLDVGITSLKAMKLRREGEKVALEAFDVVDHDTFLSEPDVDKDEIIRGTLRKFLDRNPIRGEAVFIGVPGSSTFARFVKLPPVDPKKIPEIVKFEAIQQIPFPLDQVNWDYQTFTNPDAPDVEVGIFAMKKELVGQVLSNFRALGMTVHGVQMSPLAVYNAAAYDGMTDGKGTVVIDMGAEHTDLVIMDQGRLWLRTINLGGNHFTDALAKSFKQPFNRAEQLKKTAATSKYQKQIFQAMRPIFADLVAEIQRSIGHYNSSHRDSRLERMVGMGNPFKLPNLQKYLQQELKMETVRLDRFRKMEVDTHLAPGLTENILPLTAAYGLAVQGLELATIDTNLLPLEIARQMMWRKKRPWFYAAGLLVVAASSVTVYEAYATTQNYTSAANDTIRDRNDQVVDGAIQAGRQWNSAQTTFDNNLHLVEGAMRVGAWRPVWPSIYLDVLEALPQAHGRGSHPAATAPAGTAIVVLAVDSDYTATLTAPVAGAMGTVAAGPAVPDDHGFILKITGYTSGSSATPGYEVVGKYALALRDRAPKSGSKPYFITLPEGYITGIPPATPAPWGASKGPYWVEFAEEIAGIAPELKPVTPAGAVPGGGSTDVKPPVDLTGIDLYARSPTGGRAPSIDGFQFILTVQVHMRDSAK